MQLKWALLLPPVMTMTSSAMLLAHDDQSSYCDHRSPALALVLRVADFLHPVDVLAVERFPHRDVRHGVMGVAPFQFFSPDGNHTTSPGLTSSIGPPSICT